MLEDEIKTIVATLRPEDRECLRLLPEDRLMLLHRTLGFTLRNAFRAGTYPYLFAQCDQQETVETRSFDSISETAIKLIWQHIRDATNVA
jgi:hypothetical protein